MHRELVKRVVTANVLAQGNEAFATSQTPRVTARRLDISFCNDDSSLIAVMSAPTRIAGRFRQWRPPHGFRDRLDAAQSAARRSRNNAAELLQAIRLGPVSHILIRCRRRDAGLPASPAPRADLMIPSLRLNPPQNPADPAASSSDRIGAAVIGKPTAVSSGIERPPKLRSLWRKSAIHDLGWFHHELDVVGRGDFLN